MSVCDWLNVHLNKIIPPSMMTAPTSSVPPEPKKSAQTPATGAKRIEAKTVERMLFKDWEVARMDFGTFSLM